MRIVLKDTMKPKYAVLPRYCDKCFSIIWLEHYDAKRIGPFVYWRLCKPCFDNEEREAVTH